VSEARKTIRRNYCFSFMLCYFKSNLWNSRICKSFNWV